MNAVGNWKGTKQEADDYTPSAIEWLKIWLPKAGAVRLATQEEDQSRNTDIVVEHEGLEPLKVGLRIRSEHYLGRYPYDITIRTERPYGSTEFSKISDGHGDLFFYGFGHDPSRKVRAARLARTRQLAMFFDWWRDWHEATMLGIEPTTMPADLFHSPRPGFEHRNIDSSSKFVAINTLEAMGVTGWYDRIIVREHGFEDPRPTMEYAVGSLCPKYLERALAYRELHGMPEPVPRHRVHEEKAKAAAAEDPVFGNILDPVG